VITVYSLGFAVALFGVAIAIHTAQSWLEQRTYTKHFGD
jgi:preprotein translocase subunit Sec63